MYAQTKDCTPYRDVEIVDDGVIVTYRFRGAIHQQDPLYPDAKFWKIPGFGQNSIAGEPAYPFRWDTFAVPDGATAEVEILESEYSDTLFTLAPAYPPIIGNDTIGYTPDIVIPIQPYAGDFPSSVLKKNNIQCYRGQKLIQVCTMPIQYNMELKRIRTYHFIKYKVSFILSNGTKLHGSVLPKENNKKIPGSDCFLYNLTENYLPASTRDLTVPDNQSYLILTTTPLISAAQQFAEWKRTQGFRVYIEARNNWTSVDSVKSVVREQYNLNDIFYLLIIGDINEVPVPSLDFVNLSGHYDHVSDLTYGFMDNDSVLDIFTGRIPTSTLLEANTVVNKIINYEKTPPTLQSFYQKALLTSSFQDDIEIYYENGHRRTRSGHDGQEDPSYLFIQTSENIKNHLDSLGYDINRSYYAYPYIYPRTYANGDSLPIYLQKIVNDPSRYQWNGNANEIKSLINNGVFFTMHIGHGLMDTWGPPEFRTSHIAELDNKEKLPVVFSICCLTGKYNSSNDCLAEAFLKKENGGCVAIIAATRESFSPTSANLARTLIDAIWPTDSIKPMYEIGKILNWGLTQCEHNHLYDYYLQYHREIFHCFGDPSMMIYTDMPQHFQNQQITYRNGKLIVQTSEDDVRISFYTPQTNNVDSYMGNYVEYPTTADSVIVCLDKHNYVPYIQTYQKNLFIQNEIISEQRSYVGKTIVVGNHVTNTQSTGDVLIQNANIKLEGENVSLMPGTTIINSDVKINTGQ